MVYIKKVLKMSRLLSCMLIAGVFMATSVVQAADLLKKDYPSRYVIKKGDTLWDIAGKFLNDAWRWPEIWKKNKDIENPDLIYPDDVLVLSFVDGNPVLRKLQQQKLSRSTVVLTPTAREESLLKAIPPISPRAIKPFLISPLVTTQSEIASAAYIVDGVSDSLVGGGGTKMYARGLKEESESKYHIFRAGRVFLHPDTKEELGREAIDIGTASLVAPGDPAIVKVLSSRESVEIGDLVKPVNGNETLPFFFPSTHPDESVHSLILGTEVQTSEVGATDIVTLAFGEREGVKPGQVFRVFAASADKKDRVTGGTYSVPFNEVGLVMVLRVFEKVSYAIITNASSHISAGDRVAHPKASLTWEDVHSQRAANIEKYGKKTFWQKIFKK